MADPFWTVAWSPVTDEVRREDPSESRSLSELKGLTNALGSMGVLGSFPDAWFVTSGVLGPM